MFHPLIQRIVQTIAVPEGGKVVELGNQTMMEGNRKVSSENFYRKLGWDEYQCLDISKKWNAMAVDLNWQPDTSGEFAKMFELFDLVTNNGTGEHIFNQANVFQWMHDLCKEGGIMLHILPWAGYLNHGFFSYHPVLFRDLAAVNGYEIMAMYAAERNGTMKKLDESGYHHPKPHKEPISQVEKIVSGFGERGNVFIVAVMKKGKNGPFLYPTQGKYEREYEEFKTGGTVPFVLPDAPIIPEPFPHVVIENALPEEIYRQLSDTFPDWEKFTDGDHDIGELLHINASKAVYDGGLEKCWRQFVLRHVDPAWTKMLIERFEDHIGGMMSVMPEGDLSLGVRNTGDFNLTIDCQLAVNVPGEKPISPRGPHIDSPDQIIGGLLYVPVPGDDAGGDLVLYRWRGEERKIEGKAEIPPDLVEEFAVIPYKPNTAIFFVNTMDAIHGITERKASKVPRRYVNFVLNADRDVRAEPPR